MGCIHSSAAVKQQPDQPQRVVVPDDCNETTTGVNRKREPDPSLQESPADRPCQDNSGAQSTQSQKSVSGDAAKQSASGPEQRLAPLKIPRERTEESAAIDGRAVSLPAVAWNYDLWNALAEDALASLTTAPPAIRRHLEDFMRSERNHCSLEFLKALDELVDIVETGHTAAEHARVIVDQFIRPGSAMEVNLSVTARRLSMEPGTLVFSEAREEVFRLIALDCFPRFIRSKHCDRLLTTLSESSSLTWSRRIIRHPKRDQATSPTLQLPAASPLPVPPVRKLPIVAAEASWMPYIPSARDGPTYPSTASRAQETKDDASAASGSFVFVDVALPGTAVPVADDIGVAGGCASGAASGAASGGLTTKSSSFNGMFGGGIASGGVTGPSVSRSKIGRVPSASSLLVTDSSQTPSPMSPVLTPTLPPGTPLIPFAAPTSGIRGPLVGGGDVYPITTTGKVSPSSSFRRNSRPLLSPVPIKSFTVPVSAKELLVALRLARQRLLGPGSYEWMPVFESVADLLPVSILICDMRTAGKPIIYANRHFTTLTGYTAAEVKGRSCSFLQGPGTDKVAIETMRRCFRERREAHVQLLNYRKDGTPFVNRLSLKPVFEGRRRASIATAPSHPTPPGGSIDPSATVSPLPVDAASPVYFPRSPMPAWIKPSNEHPESPLPVPVPPISPSSASSAATETATPTSASAATSPLSSMPASMGRAASAPSLLTIPTACPPLPHMTSFATVSTSRIPKPDSAGQHTTARLLFYVGVQQEVPEDEADDPTFAAKHTAIFELLPSTMSL